MKRTALIFGATGLVGNYLVKMLCESDTYESVLAFSRRPLKYTHPALEVVVDPLDDLQALSGRMTGDDLFCCLGTTIKKAGSRKKFKAVDLDMPFTLSQIAEKNKIRRFLVISSVGANADSSNFYLRTKGEMEQNVLDAAIMQISVIRPSMLLGPRKESRFGEEAGKVLMKLISPLMIGRLKKYRGIHARDVALAMLKIAEQQCEDQEIFESDELQAIAREGCNS